MAAKGLMLLLIAICLPSGRGEAFMGRTMERDQSAVQGNKERVTVMTNQEAWTLYARYLEAWTAISDERRAKIIAEVLAEPVQYSTPRHESGGRQTVINDMVAFQEKFPGGRFDVEDVSAHHDVALLTWVLIQADGKVFAKGHDQIRVSPEGKIVSLITFAPSMLKP